MSQRAFDFEGEYGGGYEALARTVIPGYLTSFRQALALLQGRLGTDARLLVVGAGTGMEIVTFRRARPGWRCTGVDPSAQMIEIARVRVKQAGLDEGVRLVHGYVEDVEDSAYSAATCFNVMHFLDDDGAKQGLLQSIADRLEPGAPFVFFDLHGERGSPEFDEQYAAWQRYWEIQGMDAEARRTFFAELEAGIRWVPESRILELLEETGFVDVQRYFRGLLYGGWIARRAAE